MIHDAIYTLRSVASDVERPAVLATGSLAACLDELKEAVLIDVTGNNRGLLRITAQRADGRPVEILAVRVSGDTA